MFEEVPVKPSGWARWSRRRYAVGPFVLGGGVLIATLGGSVAVAATVITASAVNRPANVTRVDPGSAIRATPNPTAAAGRAASRIPSLDPVRPLPRNPRLPLGPTAASGAPTATPSRPPSAPPSAPADGSSTGRSSGSAAPTSSVPTSPARSGPTGNAIIHVDGYDAGSDQLRFRFATVQSGAGPGHTDWYSAAGSQHRARLAADAQITSGDQLCPPAGSSCRPSDVIAAAQQGFFAEVAIDRDGVIRVVVERDNATGSTTPPASPSPSESTSAPSGSAAVGRPEPTSSPTP